MGWEEVFWFFFGVVSEYKWIGGWTDGWMDGWMDGYDIEAW